MIFELIIDSSFVVLSNNQMSLSIVNICETVDNISMLKQNMNVQENEKSVETLKSLQNDAPKEGGKRINTKTDFSPFTSV